MFCSSSFGGSAKNINIRLKRTLFYAAKQQMNDIHLCKNRILLAFTFFTMQSCVYFIAIRLNA